MSGISYDLNKIRGVVLDIDGVLSPSTVPMDPNGYPARMCNVKDGFALQYASRTGLNIAVISGGHSETYPQRMALLGITDIYMGIDNKINVLEKWMSLRGLEPEEIAYMGDDVPDIPCLEAVGLPCAPSDAAPDLWGHVRYFSKYKGGEGCVRDLIEQILLAQGKWLSLPGSHNW